MNYKFLEFMNLKYNSYIEDYFKKDSLPELNKKISTNFYALDALNIPIRFKEENKKTAFGWKKINKKFYHYLTDENLIDAIPDEELMKLTVLKIIKTHKSQFSKTTPLSRIFKIKFPNLLNEIN